MRREEEYWKERAEENARRVFRYSQRRAELVTRWFKRAEREMREKILAFYRRYADQEQISLQQARAALNDPRAQRLTLKEARRLAEQYPEDPVIQKLLQTDYLRRAVSREELLIQQLDLLASELYGEYAQELHKSLSEIFEEGYYRAIYDQQQYAGFGQNFDTLNANQIEAAVTTAWQGKSYSERLWGDHRVSLARYLNRIVTTGVIRGSSGAQMTAQLQKAMGIGAYEARRLIRTECCQVSNRAAVLGYQQCGTERYRFLATLDYQTSEICRGLDGQVFEVSEAVPGKNMPPMHPFCRSTTVPYWPDEEFDEGTTRAARNGRGETYRVPASMTYRQWYDQYVKPNPEELLAEKMIQNGGKDAKQWEQYTNLLGEDAPESLDKFQRIKYTDPGRYAALKRQYRQTSYYETHLTQDEKAAVSSYVSAGSYLLNVRLRDGLPLDDADRQMMRDLDAALEKLPVYEGRVIRSLVMDWEEQYHFAKKILSESSTTFSAYTSTSTEEGYHESPNVIMYIQSKTGRDLRSINPKEQEVLFRRNSRFRILNREFKNGIIYLELEEIV